MLRKYDYLLLLILHVFIVAANVAKNEHKVGGLQVQVKFMKLSDEQDEGDECGTALEVSNIPANVNEDYLQMYFENPKSGGRADCVKDITIIKPGIAHIQLTDAASKPSMNLMCICKQTKKVNLLAGRPAFCTHAIH